MFKKSLSLAIVLCMVMSLFVITPVSAGAPVVLDGATQVIFDQNLGGLSGANGAPGFTIETASGSAWNYMDYFIIGDGGNRSVTSPVVDLTNADNWTFSTKLSHSYNSYDIYLAYANGKGYILRNNRGTKTLSLYKDTVTTALASVSLDAYNVDTTITVTYNKASNKLTVKNSKNSNVIEYIPEDTADVPNLNGYFKIQGNSAGVFTVFNMYLEKFTDKIIIDQWKYDKTFTASNTQAELEADGFTFSAATAPSASGLNFKNKTFTFGPNGKDFSGDYYFETKLSRKQNFYTFDFNNSSAGYYRIEYGRIHSNSIYTRPWVRLYKYDASSKKTHVLVHHDKTSIPSGVTRTYKGTVKTLEDGSVDINIGIYNGSTLECTLAYTDTATDTVAVTTTTTTPVVDENGDPVYEEDGVTQKTETTTTTEYVDTGAPLTSGKMKIKSESSGDSYMTYLKSYSLGEATEGTPVTYSIPVINKTFSSTDTEASIESEGFTTSKSSGVTTSFANNYLKFSGKNNTLIYTNADATSGSYSFSTVFKHGNSYARVYFNYKDSSNHYVLYGDNYNSPKGLTFRKVSGGKSYDLGFVSFPNANSSGRAQTTVTVDVTKNDDGSLAIKAKWSNSALSHEFNYTDTDTDMIDTDGDGVEETNTGAPIISGATRVYQGYSASYVYSFSLTKYETVMEGGSDGVPVFEGKFTTDAGAIKEISKDTIYFEYPTAMLGSYKVVAALYEDYKMTDSKVIEPLDLYSGKVKLFDTTNSTAEDMKIRVYFFDNGENLKLVADEIYELK